MAGPIAPKPETKIAAKPKAQIGRHHYHKIKDAQSAVKTGTVVAGSTELAAANMAERAWEAGRKGQTSNGDSRRAVTQELSSLKMPTEFKFTGTPQATTPPAAAAKGAVVKSNGPSKAFKQAFNIT